MSEQDKPDLSVLPKWVQHAVIAWEATPKEYSYQFPEAVRDLRKVAEYAAELKARLDDYEADRRRVLSGECAEDEKHCACVPVLRQEIARLRATLKQLMVILEMGTPLQACLDGLRIVADALEGTELSYNSQLTKE